MLGLENVLIKPLLTEKTSKETEAFNRYAFVVNTKANKNQIKSAVEKFFDVKVISFALLFSLGKQNVQEKVIKRLLLLRKLMFNSKTARRLNSSRAFKVKAKILWQL